jgi:hypothetical protein
MTTMSLSERDIELHNISLVLSFIEAASQDGDDHIIANMITASREELQQMLKVLDLYQPGDRLRIEPSRKPATDDASSGSSFDESSEMNENTEMLIIDIYIVFIKNAIQMQDIMSSK